MRQTPNMSRKGRSNFTRLVMFDFDGTLFKSDEAGPSWWDAPGPYSWGLDPRSLDEPCVPSRPGPAYWNSAVVSAARSASNDPTAFVVLITGRVKTHAARIKELLGQVGIAPDSTYYNPGMNAATFKTRTFSHLLAKHPYVNRLEVWENENQSVYDAWIRRVSEVLGREISLEVFPVRESHVPAKCTPQDMGQAPRIGAHSLTGAEMADQDLREIARKLIDTGKLPRGSLLLDHSGGVPHWGVDLGGAEYEVQHEADRGVIHGTINSGHGDGRRGGEGYKVDWMALQRFLDAFGDEGALDAALLDSAKDREREVVKKVTDGLFTGDRAGRRLFESAFGRGDPRVEEHSVGKPTKLEVRFGNQVKSNRHMRWVPVTVEFSAPVERKKPLVGGAPFKTMSDAQLDEVIRELDPEAVGGPGGWAGARRYFRSMSPRTQAETHARFLEYTRKTASTTLEASWGPLLRVASPADQLTAYATRQFAQAAEMSTDAHDRAIILANTVGRQAKRLGLTPDEASSWLQGAYGSIWVRLGNLNPGADLREVRAALLKAMR